MNKIKYIPKLGTALFFLVFLLVNFLIFSGRKSETLQPEFLLSHFPGFYHHVANFTISCMLYAITGYMWLLFGVTTKNIVILGVIFIALNFIYELWIPVLNTRDVVDAYYGCAGVLAAFIFLILIKKFGLKLNPKWKG
jgi:hypothetical protein